MRETPNMDTFHAVKFYIVVAITRKTKLRLKIAYVLNGGGFHLKF